MPRVGRFELVDDVSPATWVVESLHPFAQDVGSVVPEGFAAYARVFHPARRITGAGEPVPVSWREIAEAHGRVAHGRMQLESLTGVTWQELWRGEPPLWDQAPEEGSLPDRLAEQLASILGRHTQDPARCWFGFWEGFGDLGIRDLVAARVPVPKRPMLLLSGPLDAVRDTVTASGRYQSPNLWWPAERTWCVASEIDFGSTYVGASEAAIRSVLASDLEAFSVEVTDPIGVLSDDRNPTPYAT
jgi:hypothetical protein